MLQSARLGQTLMLVDSLIFIQPTCSLLKLVLNELFVPTGGHFSFICDYSKNRTVTPATLWPHAPFKNRHK